MACNARADRRDESTPDAFLKRNASLSREESSDDAAQNCRGLGGQAVFHHRGKQHEAERHEHEGSFPCISSGRKMQFNL